MSKGKIKNASTAELYTLLVSNIKNHWAAEIVAELELRGE